MTPVCSGAYCVAPARYTVWRAFDHDGPERVVHYGTCVGHACGRHLTMLLPDLSSYIVERLP